MEIFVALMWIMSAGCIVAAVILLLLDRWVQEVDGFWQSYEGDEP